MKQVEETLVNTNNEKYMQGLGVTEGTIAQVTKDEMLKNLRNDVTSYEKALENAKKDYDNYKEQLDLDIRLWEITNKPKAMELIVPERNYELDPAFSEIAQKKQFFKNRQDRAVGEGQLKLRETKVNDVTSALERAKEKLKKFEDE